MRMTLWFESLRRQFGSVTGATSRRHGSGQTWKLTPAFVESLEDRCLLSAGDLDLSFGQAGRITTLVGTGNSNGLTALGAIQADGKIIVAGTAYENGNRDAVLVRYNSDGSLDTSLDLDGIVTTDLGTTEDSINSVLIQPDGRIVVVGNVLTAGNSEFALARYNGDGSLDSTFDGDGKVATNFGTSAVSTSMVLQQDGKIVVAGYAGNFFALARYNADGSLDTTFDGDGLLTAQVGVGVGVDQANSVALQTDGKIVVAGQTSRGGNDFALARFNSNGELDSSFDGDGKLTTSFGASRSIAKSVVLQSDGKLLVGGYFGDNGVLALARYKSDGSLDSSFDGDGKRRTNFGILSDYPLSMKLQVDGNTVVAATTRNEDFNVLRIKPNGEFDLTFGANGGVTTDFGFSVDQAQSVALQNDGKIVVVGLSEHEGSYPIAVARYLSGRPTAITSPPAVSISENQSSVATITAVTEQRPPLLFGITGGADQSKFTLNFLTGALSFVSPPDFEHPTDADHDNVYEVQVAVSDGTNLVTQNVTVSVTNVNEAPVITSNGAGASAAINIPENQTAVTTVTATDVDMPAQSIAYSITGGADATKFNITSGGVLTFVTLPDFEIPTDVDGDNVYVVHVTATDDGTGNLTDVQMISVTVTDVAVLTGAPLITGPPLASPSQRPPVSWTAVNGATEYEIWIAKNPSTSLYHGATVTSNSYTPPMDFGIGKFNVWVRAKNSESLGPWTAKYTFVINTPVVPQTITRQQPTLRPTIIWNSLPGAVRYDVWIDDASRNISQYIRNTNVAGTTFTPSAGLPLGVYRAWVRGIAADGTAGLWSPAVEFVTMQAPTIIQGQNSTFSRTPTFSWEALAGAAKYELVIRNRNTGATTVEERNVTGLSFTPTAPLADGPYRWWAVGVSAQGVRSFWTAPLDIYIGGRTELLSPAGNSNVPTPTFTWRPVDGAVRYDLWVNQIGGQAQIIRQQNLSGTSFTASSSLPTGSYRAWIRAISSAGEASPWSREVVFAVAAIPRPSQSETPNVIPDEMLVVLTLELQAQRLGSNTTRASSRIAEAEVLPPERTLKIVGNDRTSPQSHETRSAQFDDDYLVPAIHEFLDAT